MRLTDAGVVEVVEVAGRHAVLGADDEEAAEPVLSEEDVAPVARALVVLAGVGGLARPALQVAPRGAVLALVDHWK